MKNLNLLFNKLYYEKLGHDDFENNVKRCNNQIFSARFDHAKDYTESKIASNKFVLKTTYPGLLIGTGNPHGGMKSAGAIGMKYSSNDDINMGFSFDYVSGQPYIPASSVKGVLRCHFKECSQAVCEILGKDIDVAALENEIFEGTDVFLDAVVFDGNEYGLLIGSDYITPHSKVTENPVPIYIIKVLPDVRFEFRFILTDGIVTAAEKEALFSRLLQIFGVGAKTNVGYGFMSSATTEIGAKKPLPESGGNRFNPTRTQNSGSSQPESVICKACNTSNFKYYPDGNLRKKCRKCGEFLYPRR